MPAAWRPIIMASIYFMSPAICKAAMLGTGFGDLGTAHVQNDS